jgi:hypothetical protein
MIYHSEFQVEELLRFLEFEHDGRATIMLEINSRLKSLFSNVSTFFSNSQKSGDDGIISFTLYFFIQDEQISATTNEKCFEQAESNYK